MPPTEPADLEPLPTQQPPQPEPTGDERPGLHTIAPTGRPVPLVSTSRYGDLDQHELVRLLDTFEDERSRGRFRESIYISLFVWIAIAWFVFYGPRLLWHQRLISPVDVLKQRELTELIAPRLHPPMAHIENKLDRGTLEKLRREEPPAPRPTAAPHEVAQPTPQPSASTPAPPTPTRAAPTPTPAPTPLPPTPTPLPRQPAASVPDAPRPQPTPHVNFGQGNTSAGEAVANAARESASGGSTGGYGGGRSGGGRSSPLSMGGAEILSDTQGVNFKPYLSRILDDIYRNWIPLIPEEARPPLNKQGETYIQFIILPDGNIGGMRLVGSTHDDAINHSAWGSITSEGQFPPLPKEFHGPNLELRIHYLVNKGNGE